jgi:ABC-type bacteriocin/lantibiotic exporter with double-glycine peptidase domain
MFNQYEPNVNATIALLRQLKVKVNNKTVDDTLQNHPDWPSLLCIGDALGKWHIPNGAGKIESSLIEELPLPFLAYTHNREHPLAVVTGVTASKISYYTKDYTKPITISREEFIKN